MTVYLEHVEAKSIRVHQVKGYKVETVEVSDCNCVCTTISVETEDSTVEIKLFIDHKYLKEGKDHERTV